jgi:hypothetical protein
MIVGISMNCLVQETLSQAMEKRARELHRVITLSDKEVWKKFIQENYAQSLIDKPMKENIQIDEAGNHIAARQTTASNLEAKAEMFRRLHADFGQSKIKSLKPDNENMEMVLEADSGTIGNFKLRFSKVSPFLIENLGIQVASNQR